MTAEVAIEAIDAKVPSMTVRSKNGRRMSFKVENAKNLEGYKAGDNVEVTYRRSRSA
jgi:Cu/Ag efflux protein CusF